MKAQLKKQYGTSTLNGEGKPFYDFTIVYEEMKYGTPYEGTYRHDGVPPNTKTQVYPVKTQMLITKKANFGEGKSTRSHVTVKSGFFRDSFGDWSFRNQEEKRDDLK